MKKRKLSRKSRKMSKKSRKRKKTEIKGTPLANTPIFFAVHPEGRKPEVNYQMLWNYVRTSPELMSILSAISEDILSDGWKLTGGRNNKLRAEKFLEENFAKQQFMTFWFDALVTGDAYIWKSKLERSDLEKTAFKLFPPLNVKKEFKNLIVHEAVNDIIKESRDEDILRTRAFRIVPSSTMLAKWDKYGNVQKYVQKVGPAPSQIESFSPEEIIHFRYLNLDGKFFGFTPLITLLQELSILSHIKNFAQYYFEKGGVPDMMFILEEEVPTSPNFEAFKQELQRYAVDTNKHKSLLVTGKVKAEQLNRLSKDMEFRELARYVTQVIVMAWNIPSSRLSDLLISRGVRGATTSSEGYYRKISHLQDIFEDVINSQLLLEFGVKLKFNKAYLQDEVREVQTTKIKADVCEQLRSLGIVNDEWCWEYLNIPENMRGEGKSEEKPKQRTGLMNQDLLNNLQLLGESPEREAENRDKQTAALRQKP